MWWPGWWQVAQLWDDLGGGGGSAAGLRKESEQREKETSERGEWKWEWRCICMEVCHREQGSKEKKEKRVSCWRQLVRPQRLSFRLNFRFVLYDSMYERCCLHHRPCSVVCQEDSADKTTALLCTCLRVFFFWIHSLGFLCDYPATCRSTVTSACNLHPN